MKDLWHHLAPLVGAFHYFIAFIVGGIVVAVRKYLHKLRENRAAMWPSADGMVQTATIKKEQHGSWVEVCVPVLCATGVSLRQEPAPLRTQSRG